MKDIIEKLKAKVAEGSEYKWNDTSKIDVSLSDVKKIIEFYETTSNSKEESNSIIAPNWDNIPEGYNWVAIDEDGREWAFTYKPSSFNSIWYLTMGGKVTKTDRIFDMSNIDWTKTLSKRPNN